MNSTAQSVTYTFVCQSGELELMAALLLASMQGKILHEHEIVIGIPKPFSVMQEPSKRTLDFCTSLNAKIFYFTNHLFTDSDSKYSVKRRHQLLANKIFLLQQVESTMDYTVFLDSDQVLVEAVPKDANWLNNDVSARLVGGIGAKAVHDCYQKIYEAAHVTLPAKRVIIPYNNEEHVIPKSANTSFISLRNNCKTRITNKWIDLYKDIIATDIMKHDYFSEQSCFVPAVLSEGHHCNYISPESFIHYIHLAKIDSLEENKQAKFVRDDLYVKYPVLMDINNSISAYSH